MTIVRHPLFFQISMGGKKSYILGTCHSLPTSTLPQEAIEIIDSTSTFYCESGYTPKDLTYPQLIDELRKPTSRIERIDLKSFIESYYSTNTKNLILGKIQGIIDVSDVTLTLNSIDPIKAICILKYIGMDSSIKRTFANLGKKIYALDSGKIEELLDKTSMCSCSPFCNPYFSNRYMNEDILKIYLEESCVHDRTGKYNQLRNSIWSSFMISNLRMNSLSTYAVGAAHIFGTLQILSDHGAVVHRMNRQGELIELDFPAICDERITKEIRVSFSIAHRTYLSYMEHIEKENSREETYLKCADRVIQAYTL